MKRVTKFVITLDVDVRLYGEKASKVKDLLKEAVRRGLPRGDLQAAQVEATDIKVKRVGNF